MALPVAPIPHLIAFVVYSLLFSFSLSGRTCISLSLFSVVSENIAMHKYSAPKCAKDPQTAWTINATETWNTLFIYNCNADEGNYSVPANLPLLCSGCTVCVCMFCGLFYLFIYLFFQKHLIRSFFFVFCLYFFISSLSRASNRRNFDFRGAQWHLLLWPARSWSSSKCLWLLWRRIWEFWLLSSVRKYRVLGFV